MRRLAACALLAALLPCQAAVHLYNGVFTPLNDAYVFRGGREGMFRSHRDKDAAGIANGVSNIRLSEVEFIRSKDVASRHEDSKRDEVTGSIVAVVFKVNERGRIGYQQPGNGTRRYCCTASLSAEIGCEVERPIIAAATARPGGQRHPWTSEVSFRGTQEVAVAKDAAVEVEVTGMYHLWFVTCDAHLAAARVEGHTAWKNPNGYLPGMMAPNLPFFAAMSCAYVALSLAWLTACVLAWRHVIALQHCISAVLLLGMAEMLTWYIDYSDFNNSGFRPYATTVVAVLLGALRKTLSRMLLLVAAMGFGIVRPTLGDATWRVAALGASYFAVSCGLDVTTHVGTIDDLTRGARIMQVAPVAALDATFILWTFTALSTTLAMLGARRAAAPKLDLYTKFTNALAVAVTLSIAWIGYEMWYKLTDAHNAHWRSDWVTSAFWHVLSFALIAAMCATWRPGDAVEQFVRSSGDAFMEDPASPGAVASRGALPGSPGRHQTVTFTLEGEAPPAKIS